MYEIFTNMKEQRFKRYAKKVERIQHRLTSIREWSDGFLTVEKDRLATYKAFQEVAEAAMDIIAMMVTDEGLVPEDDYRNIQKLAQEAIFSDELQDQLKEVNGLRNRIVHEYNGLDHEIALESMKQLQPAITEFVGVVKRWLEEQH